MVKKYRLNGLNAVKCKQIKLFGTNRWLFAGMQMCCGNGKQGFWKVSP
jgi:hypothetical protein